MNFSKKGIIENFTIGDEAISRLRLDAKKGNPSTFDEMIVQPLWPGLSERLAKNYPQIQAETKDILTDVFLKFRKQICKDSFDLANFDFKEQLLFLFTAECQLAIPNDEITEKNLNLSRKEFKSLLQQLRQGDETLIEKIYLSHFKKCIKYLVYQCQSNFDDAYASSMEALLEIRKDLIKGKIFYGNLDFYFTRRAKNKWFKLKIKQNKLQDGTAIEDIDVEDQEYIESDIYATELKELVSEAIKKLCGDCKGIVRMYYFEEISLKEIAEMMDKTHAAIRKQVTRCRDKLRTHLGEDFYKKFAANFKE